MRRHKHDGIFLFEPSVPQQDLRWRQSVTMLLLTNANRCVFFIDPMKPERKITCMIRVLLSDARSVVPLSFQHRADLGT